jgi:hypothetical protein
MATLSYEDRGTNLWQRRGKEDEQTIETKRKGKERKRKRREKREREKGKKGMGTLW